MKRGKIPGIPLHLHSTLARIPSSSSLSVRRHQTVPSLHHTFLSVDLEEQQLFCFQDKTNLETSTLPRVLCILFLNQTGPQKRPTHMHSTNLISCRFNLPRYISILCLWASLKIFFLDGIWYYISC